MVGCCITAKERGDDIIFLRKLQPGGADRSYGVAVAALAGLPNDVTARAREIMAKLEVAEIQQDVNKRQHTLGRSAWPDRSWT